MESAEKEFRILESLRCETDKVYHPLLYQYQQAGVELIIDNLSRLRFCYQGDPIGSGKTAQVIVACGMLGRRTLVVVPKMLLIKWKREVEKFGNGARASIISKPGDFEKATGLFVIVAYDFFKLHISKFHRFDFKLVIFDEVQFLKNANSQRTQRLLPFCEGKKVICISASPFSHSPVDVWPILYHLCPEAIDGAGYYAFALRYMHKIVDSYGHEMFRGGKNLQELGQRMRCYGLIRRTKEKILPFLPKYTVEIVELKTGYKKRDYDREEFASESLSIPFDKIAEARSEYAEAKKEPLKEFIELLLASDEKVVVFCHHQNLICFLVDYFKALKIDGGMSQQERQQSLDSFQKEEAEKLIVCSISACGYGIELTASHIAVFGETSWSHEDNVQALGRLVRIGATQHTNVYYAVCEDTLDYYMLKKAIEKEKISNNILTN